MRSIQKRNFRVVVEPRDPGDFGFVRIGGQTISPNERERQCEKIASEIRHHVGGLPSYGNRGVSVEWDEFAVCRHCGADWTEPSELYNGGCCQEDNVDREQRGTAEAISPSPT